MKNGVNGCSRPRVSRSTRTRVPRAAAELSPSSVRRLLASSRYQSQKSFQTKRYRAEAASLNW